MTAFSNALLCWYRAGRIQYPWRSTSDPYRIWVSEVLLQQTRISVALPFYEKIVARYPSFEALAKADRGEFLAAWSGIGYYRRAENMLVCARQVVTEHGGRFPADFESLCKLAGIGSYTAGAIRNLCFGELTPALDGNVSRVLARLVGCHAPSTGREFQRTIADAFMKHGRDTAPADYMQALMELGEQVCLPKPSCGACPVSRHCVARRDGVTTEIPARPAPQKQTSMYWYFFLIRKNDAFLFVQNPDRAFLKDAWLFPDILSERILSPAEIRKILQKHWKIRTEAFKPIGNIRHTVTFRKISGHIFDVSQPIFPPSQGLWLTPKELNDRHTSSVARKILKVSELAAWRRGG